MVSIIHKVGESVSIIKNALIYLTVPGTIDKPRNNFFLRSLRERLQAEGIEAKFVDTIPGWGCLNQDWLQFRTTIETSWGWCHLSDLAEMGSEFFPRDEENWADKVQDLLHAGKLVMQVYYENGEPHA
jgi:hypothetical protein